MPTLFDYLSTAMDKEGDKSYNLMEANFQFFVKEKGLTVEQTRKTLIYNYALECAGIDTIEIREGLTTFEPDYVKRVMQHQPEEQV